MKTTPTHELIVKLTEAMKTGNQNLINMCAQELATRLYVPNEKYTFEQTLEGFGYRKIEQDPRQISIEEYMRERNK